MHLEHARSFFPSLVFVSLQPGRLQISPLAAAAAAAVGGVVEDDAGDCAAAVIPLVVADDDDVEGSRPPLATRLDGLMA